MGKTASHAVLLNGHTMAFKIFCASGGPGPGYTVLQSTVSEPRNRGAGVIALLNSPRKHRTPLRKA